MKFDRQKFYDNYRQQYGSLSSQQVTGLNRLLDGIERDPHIPDDQTGLQYAAYMLATVKRETAHTFMPIHEYGGHNYFVQRYGGQTRKGRELGNDTPEEGFVYRGAGDVQLTGESNFEKAEVALRREYPELVADFERRTGKMFDLTVGDQENDAGDANNVLDPAVSYAILSFGMRTGMFTGRRLSQFFPNGKPDYFNMRTIVNGHDHAQEIANDAVKFERILRSSTETFDDLLDVPQDSAAVPDHSVPAGGDSAVATPVPVHPDPPIEQPPTIPEVPPSPDKVVVEKEAPPPGFFEGIKLQVAGWLASIGGTSQLRQYSDDAQVLGFSGVLLKYTVFAVIAAFLLWLGYRAVKYAWATVSKRWLTTALVKANSTPTNVVAVAESCNLAQLEKEGWVVVRRI